MKKLFEIIELCKKLSKSTPTEQNQDKLYKLIDGTLSPVAKQNPIKQSLKLDLPPIPKVPGLDVPTGTRQKNKVGGSEV